MSKNIWEISPTTYEQLTPKRYKKHGTVIWTVIMAMFSGLGFLFQYINHEIRYPISAVFLATIGILLPSIVAWVRNIYLNLYVQLSTFVKAPKEKLEKFSQDVACQTLTGTWKKWFMGILNATAGIFTISYLGIPFQSNLLKITSVISLAPLLFFCGTAAYNVILSLTIPSRIAKFPIEVPLYQDRYTGVTSLNWMMFSFSLLGMFFYALLLGAIITSPYSLDSIIFIWLSVIGLFVALILPTAFFGLHNTMKKAKRDALVKFAEHLEKATRKVLENPTKENLEIIQAMFQFRKELENLPEWPFDFKTVITLVSTVLFPVVGFVLQFVK